jgi:hypothetical protein
VKHFFARMSFPRAVILFCTLGSVALGVLVWLRAQRLAEVKEELARVPEIVREIQTDAYRLDDLQRSADSEKFKAQSEPLTYIQGIGAEKNVNMGQLKIDSSDKTPARGIEDKIYKISPDTKAQKYPRLQIANFLYRLEEASRRVKITRLKLTPFEKVSPGEVVKDQWTFEADLTTRTKLDTAPTGGGQG